MLQRMLALFVLAVAACTGPLGETNGGRVEYAVSAGDNYERGMKALKSEEWVEAAKYFTFVKSRFPYSRFAVLAELRLADAELGGGANLEAADSYRMFIKFHPTHEMVTNGYCQYKIGEAYYKMLPDDWFLLPPSHEKDQSQTHDALRELAAFLEQYPSSKFVPEAQKMWARCAKKLADHEYYVARFYWSRNRPMGTVLRLRTLLTRYPGVGYDEDALLLLARAYVKVDRPEDARTALATLIAKYPRSSRRKAAESMLSQLPRPKG